MNLPSAFWIGTAWALVWYLRENEILLHNQCSQEYPCGHSTWASSPSVLLFSKSVARCAIATSDAQSNVLGPMVTMRVTPKLLSRFTAQGLLIPMSVGHAWFPLDCIYCITNGVTLLHHKLRIIPWRYGACTKNLRIIFDYSADMGASWKLATLDQLSRRWRTAVQY